jgi:hypothetical protein
MASGTSLSRRRYGARTRKRKRSFAELPKKKQRAGALVKRTGNDQTSRPMPPEKLSALTLKVTISPGNPFKMASHAKTAPVTRSKGHPRHQDLISLHLVPRRPLRLDPRVIHSGETVPMVMKGRRGEDIRQDIKAWGYHGDREGRGQLAPIIAVESRKMPCPLLQRDRKGRRNDCTTKDASAIVVSEDSERLRYCILAHLHLPVRARGVWS